MKGRISEVSLNPYATVQEIDLREFDLLEFDLLEDDFPKVDLPEQSTLCPLTFHSRPSGSDPTNQTFMVYPINMWEMSPMGKPLSAPVVPTMERGRCDRPLHCH